MKTVMMPARESAPPAVDAEPELACRHLRTKRMFIPAESDGCFEVNNERNDRSFYWCNHTQTEIGKDGGQAHTRVCLCARPCYEKAP